jgi:hypothetical protein
MTIKVHDKRFGVIAVEKRFITKEQLFEALRIQVEEDLSEILIPSLGLYSSNLVISLQNRRTKSFLL